MINNDKVPQEKAKSRRKATKATSAIVPRAVMPNYLKWGWEFLRRNEEYIRMYELERDRPIVPSLFGLKLWLDPKNSELPTELKDAFDYSAFELDEVWALNFKSQTQVDGRN